MNGYNIACLILTLLILAFMPAMIAAYKNHHFSRWYIYGVLVLPVAFIHSLLLKKPFYCINVYYYDEKNPASRKKKVFRAVTPEKKTRTYSPRYVCMVFAAKLIFGAFSALVLFALFRMFEKDTLLLRFNCCIFAVLFSLLLAVTELCGFSRVPLLADEITKRAILICIASVISSLPLFLIKTLVLDNIVWKYSEFMTFLCTVISTGVFLAFLLKIQHYYYSVFYKFSDYCVLSLCSYAIYAAIALICMSVFGSRNFVYGFSMPMQLFNLEYLSNMEYIENISYVYSAALAHLAIETVIFFSGLLCRSYKKKEFLYRVEYRSKAFNLSRKRVLRRHIPNAGTSKTLALQNV